MMARPLRVAMHRIACAVVAAEVRRLRGCDMPAPHDWPETMPIGDEGLGLDSLEQLGALGALAETFGLDDAALGEVPPETVKSWIDWVMHRHASGEGKITVRTSGSTGSPLPCTHVWASLMQEAEVLAQWVPQRRRIVALVPANHLYGIIWTALLPAVLDIPVVIRVVGTSLDLTAGDLVVAVPDQWRAILSLSRGFPADIVGVSSAALLQEALATDLLASGLSRLLDIYGSSETGGIAIRELPAKAYELLPHWHLVSQDGDWQLGTDDGARFCLPDYIEPFGDRSICPAGRRDGAVQVGGHNVWPARVADILRQIDGVSDVAVRLHSNGRLKAFIVPDAAGVADELAVTIERIAAERLTVAERPRNLRFGSALPRNAMGKLEDWA
jgi:4-coumarate--CoA ligase (photoactive yellow protein activation family)